MTLHAPQNNDIVRKSYSRQWQDTFHQWEIWITELWKLMQPGSEDITLASQVFADHDQRGPRVVPGLGVLIEEKVGQTVINSGVFDEHTEQIVSINFADSQNILANQIFGA